MFDNFLFVDEEAWEVGLGPKRPLEGLRSFEGEGEGRGEVAEVSLSFPFPLDRTLTLRSAATSLLPGVDSEANGPDEGDGEGNPDTSLFEFDLVLPAASAEFVLWGFAFSVDLVLCLTMITDTSDERDGVPDWSVSSFRFLRGEGDD